VVGGTVVTGPAAWRRVEGRELDRPEILRAVLRRPRCGTAGPEPALQLRGPVFKHGKPITFRLAHIFEIALHVSPYKAYPVMASC
jgi:hypothetical protein